MNKTPRRAFIDDAAQPSVTSQSALRRDAKDEAENHKRRDLRRKGGDLKEPN
jgi:hypothetical protein